MRLGIATIASVAALVAVAFPAAGQTPLGGEIHVTAPYTLPDQTAPRLSMDDDEDFVVFWRERAGQFEEFSDAYLQRFDITGAKVGGRIQANDVRDFDGLSGGVTHLCGGEFVAVWDLGDNNGDDFRIVARRFAANGVKIGQEFRVFTSMGLMFSSVAGDSQCGFTVAWSGEPSGGAHLRRYDAAGQALTGVVQVNQAGDATGAYISYAADDTFVVVWTDQTGRDGDRGGVYARRFAADGSPLGNDFLVNTFTTEDQFASGVSHAPDGSFVIVWSDRTQDGDDFGAYGQRFSASGTKVGGEFQISQTTAGRQSASGISHDGVGGFIVTFTMTPGVDFGEVYARRFALDATPLSDEFMVNVVTANQQAGGPIDARRGRFVVAWQDNGQEQPGGGPGIFARRFTTPDKVPSAGALGRGALVVGLLAIAGRRRKS